MQYFTKKMYRPIVDNTKSKINDFILYKKKTPRIIFIPIFIVTYYTG